MPVPAVFLPLEDLGGLDLAKLGFVSLMNRDEQAPLPMSRRLAADVMSTPESMSVMVFDKNLPLRPKSILKVTPGEVLEGGYVSAADEQWQNETYVAQRILLLAGPQPAQDATQLADALQWFFSPDSVITGVTLRALEP